MKGKVIEVATRGSIPVGTNNQWRWDIAVYHSELQDEILSIDNESAPSTSLSTIANSYLQL